ncbi:MAG: PHP domain-containing protein, partial [Candidatus Hadarchaeales archaeon]
MKLVDLHLHSLLSDGELLPSELARRMEELGFGTIALTDHVDWSNLEIIPKIAEVSERLSKCMGISVIAGAEL